MLEILEEARRRGAGARARDRRAVGRRGGRLPRHARRRSRSTRSIRTCSPTRPGRPGKPKGVVHVQGGFLVSIAREAATRRTRAPATSSTSRPTWAGSWARGRWSAAVRSARRSSSPRARPTGRPTGSGGSIEEERVTILGCSPTLIRALIPHGDPEADLSSLRMIVTTGEPWNPDPYRWLFERVGGGRCPIVNITGGTEVGAVLPRLAASGGADQGLLRRRAGASEWRWTSSTPRAARWSAPARSASSSAGKPFPGMTRGFWRDPERYLETYWRRFPGDLDARRLGLGRRGRLLVPARPLGRHAEHRRQADRAGRDRVGRGRASGGRRGGGGRRPARGQGRGRVGVLRARARHVRAGGGRGAALVAAELGKAFAPERVVFVPALPKTRSAKIVRRAVRATALGQRSRRHVLGREPRRARGRSPRPSADRFSTERRKLDETRTRADQHDRRRPRRQPGADPRAARARRARRRRPRPLPRARGHRLPARGSAAAARRSSARPRRSLERDRGRDDRDHRRSSASRHFDGDLYNACAVCADGEVQGGLPEALPARTTASSTRSGTSPSGRDLVAAAARRGARRRDDLRGHVAARARRRPTSRSPARSCSSTSRPRRSTSARSASARRCSSSARGTRPASSRSCNAVGGQDELVFDGHSVRARRRGRGARAGARASRRRCSSSTSTRPPRSAGGCRDARRRALAREQDRPPDGHRGRARRQGQAPSRRLSHWQGSRRSATTSSRCGSRSSSGSATTWTRTASATSSSGSPAGSTRR